MWGEIGGSGWGERRLGVGKDGRLWGDRGRVWGRE